MNGVNLLWFWAYPKFNFNSTDMLNTAAVGSELLFTNLFIPNGDKKNLTRALSFSVWFRLSKPEYPLYKLILLTTQAADV